MINPRQKHYFIDGYFFRRSRQQPTEGAAHYGYMRRFHDLNDFSVVMQNAICRNHRETQSPGEVYVTALDTDTRVGVRSGIVFVVARYWSINWLSSSRENPVY